MSNISFYFVNLIKTYILTGIRGMIIFFFLLQMLGTYFFMNLMLAVIME